MARIKYSIVSGSLPINVRLNEDTGRITGDIDYANVDLGPTWNSPEPGSIGTFNEGDTFSVTFDAKYSSNNSPAHMGVLNNGNNLPWGAVFDPETRTLSGTLAQLLAGEGFKNDNPPTWQTQFGTLGTYDEGVAVSSTVAATPVMPKTISRYAVVGGGLPWGVELNSETGAISGTTADLKDPGLTVEVPRLPVPVFSVAAGSIAIVNEEEDVANLSIHAVPEASRQMVKYVITRGGLPRGLVLNTTSGEITGKVAEMIGKDDVPVFFTQNYPTFGTTATVNGSSTTSDNLGSFSRGQVVSIQFGATYVSGRSALTYSLDSGFLPRGLIMDSQGLISGTISNHVNVGAEAKAYIFTVRVTDDKFGFATRVFNITVQ